MFFYYDVFVGQQLFVGSMDFCASCSFKHPCAPWVLRRFASAMFTLPKYHAYAS